MIRDGRLRYRDERPRYQNGRLRYQNGRPRYQNGRLRYQNGRLRYRDDPTIPRWACDTSINDCSQNVFYDAANPNVYNTAANTLSACYAASSTDATSPCARYTCNSATPFTCTAYTTAFEPTPGTLPSSIFDDASCSNSCYAPVYTCASGTTCMAFEGQQSCTDIDNCYQSMSDCQSNCLTWTCSGSTPGLQATCVQNTVYGAAGTTQADCSTSCSLALWQCGTGGGDCTNDVYYGASNYASAFPDASTCASTCSGNVGVSCQISSDGNSSMCVIGSDPGGQNFNNLQECTASGCGFYGCDPTNPSSTTCVPLAGGVYTDLASCNAGANCGMAYDCCSGMCVAQLGGQYATASACYGPCATQNYVCNPLNGICEHNVVAPTGPNNMSLTDCANQCAPALYGLTQQTFPGAGTFPWCTYNTPGGTLQAADCLLATGLANPIVDAVLYAPSNMFQDTLGPNGIQVSAYVGYGLVLGNNNVAINALVASAAPILTSPFLSPYLYYSTDMGAQGGITGRRFFESYSNAYTFTSLSQYQQHVSTTVNASFHGSSGLFSCSGQVNLEMGSSVSLTSSIMSSKLQIQINDGLIELDLRECENWNALTTDFQQEMVSVGGNSDLASSFLGAYGTHIISRIYIGKKFTNVVNNSNAQSASASDLSVAACATASYGSMFTASACNTTKTSNSSNVQTVSSTNNVIVTGGFPIGTDGFTDSQSQLSAMNFMMWENSPVNISAAMGYEYLFYGSFIKNVGRQITNQATRIAVLNAAQYITDTAQQDADTITKLWKEHVSGEKLVHENAHLWPKWYNGWKHDRIVPVNRHVGVRASHQVKKPRPPRTAPRGNDGDDPQYYDCGETGFCQPSDTPTPYTDFASCYASCGNFTCDNASGMCTQSLTGQGLPLDQCQETCSQTFMPIQTMCPDGTRCFGVGNMFTVPGNNLAKPSQARNFYASQYLALDTIPGQSQSCVSGQYGSSGSQTYTAQSDTTSQALSSMTSSTSVTAAYHGGSANVNASASVGVGKSTSMASDIMSQSLMAYNPVASYQISMANPICNTIDALDANMLNALLSLPPVVIYDPTYTNLGVYPAITSPPVWDVMGDDLQEHYDFIQTYGSHMVTTVNLGGLISDTLSTNSTNTSDQQSLLVSACAGGSGSGISAQACAAHTNSSSGYNASLTVNSSKSIVGADGYTRATFIDPNLAPSTIEWTNVPSTYLQPVNNGVTNPYVFTPIWQQLYQMAGSALANDVDVYLWTQILTKSLELCYAYYSRYCVTDVYLGNTQPTPTYGSDGNVGQWVQVTNWGCGNPSTNMYAPLNPPQSSAMNVVFGYNNGSAANYFDESQWSAVDGFDYLDNTGPMSGTGATTFPTPLSDLIYFWVKWEFVCLPTSQQNVVTTLSTSTTSQPSYRSISINNVTCNDTGGINGGDDNVQRVCTAWASSTTNYIIVNVSVASLVFQNSIPFVSTVGLIVGLNSISTTQHSCSGLPGGSYDYKENSYGQTWPNFPVSGGTASNAQGFQCVGYDGATTNQYLFPLKTTTGLPDTHAYCEGHSSSVIIGGDPPMSSDVEMLVGYSTVSSQQEYYSFIESLLGTNGAYTQYANIANLYPTPSTPTSPNIDYYDVTDVFVAVNGSVTTTYYVWLDSAQTGASYVTSTSFQPSGYTLAGTFLSRNVAIVGQTEPEPYYLHQTTDPTDYGYCSAITTSPSPPSGYTFAETMYAYSASTYVTGTPIPVCVSSTPAADQEPELYTISINSSACTSGSWTQQLVFYTATSYPTPQIAMAVGNDGSSMIVVGNWFDSNNNSIAQRVQAYTELVAQYDVPNFPSTIPLTASTVTFALMPTSMSAGLSQYILTATAFTLTSLAGLDDTALAMPINLQCPAITNASPPVVVTSAVTPMTLYVYSPAIAGTTILYIATTPQPSVAPLATLNVSSTPGPGLTAFTLYEYTLYILGAGSLVSFIVEGTSNPGISNVSATYTFYAPSSNEFSLFYGQELSSLVLCVPGSWQFVQEIPGSDPYLGCTDGTNLVVYSF